MINWVHWDGESLASLAEVKVGTCSGRMHALEASTNNRLSAANSVANGAMADLFAHSEVEII